MKDVLEYVARHLVDDPDAVTVEEVVGPRTTVLQLNVAPEDRGKVIGRGGRTARALRTLMRAAGVQFGSHAMVEIVG